MHCPTCKVPLITPECPYCKARERSEAETAAASRPAAKQPQALPVALGEFPRWREIYLMLHHLWGKAVEGPGYDKTQWAAFEQYLMRLAIEGLGERVPLPPRTREEDPTVPIAKI